jgi:hypothetical protein
MGFWVVETLSFGTETLNGRVILWNSCELRR